MKHISLVYILARHKLNFGGFLTLNLPFNLDRQVTYSVPCISCLHFASVGGNFGTQLLSLMYAELPYTKEKDLTPLCPASKTQETDDEKNVSFLND